MSGYVACFSVVVRVAWLTCLLYVVGYARFTFCGLLLVVCFIVLRFGVYIVV